MGNIRLHNIGKAYKQYPNKFARLKEWLGIASSCHRLKWVLHNINLEIKSGEAVGLIGINGAGKSTLLKMILGTTEPTVGSIHTTGRITGLLELGMGFHPDFTGWQNVYMSGQLLGMTKQQITDLMPEIQAFAEIGEYIHLPIRVYSSGMEIRLAFSIATALRPDILIIDEAFSVGDAYFQHKSFSKIKTFRELGTTLLIVSHDKQSIINVCDRAILLSGTEIKMEGRPEIVMDYYNALLTKNKHEPCLVDQRLLESGAIQTISGTGEAYVMQILLLNEDHQPINLLKIGQKVILQIIPALFKDLKSLVVGFTIKNHIGQTCFYTDTLLMQQSLKNISHIKPLIFSFEFEVNLGVGSYSIQTLLANEKTEVYELKTFALLFNIINVDNMPFEGQTWLMPTLTIGNYDDV